MIGDGAPALIQVPAGTLGSYRDEVGEVAELMGRPLDSHQLVAVEALTSYTAGGKWPCLTAAVEGPRQTVGKTAGILLPIAATLSLLFEPDDRIWTAHRVDTAAKTFADMQALIEGSAGLSAKVRKISLENGDEHIRFTNGARLGFKTRSSRSGRGLSGNDVFADEGLYATGAQFGALLPTMATRSARGRPRLWLGSSAALVESTWWRGLRKRAVGGDPTVCFVGWWARGGWTDPGCALGMSCTHVPGTDGCSLDDVSRWHEANPGLGRRTAVDFLHEMRHTLPPLEFGREFLGWEDGGADDETTPIKVEAWDARVDPRSGIPDGAPRWLGVDMTPARTAAAIGGAGLRPDGDIHLALVDHRQGTSWVLPRLLELLDRYRVGAIVIDTASPAATLIDELLKPRDAGGAGLKIRSKENPRGTLVVAGAAQMGQACGRLQDGVVDGTPPVWHRGDPAARTAVENAGRRGIGDGMWGFARRRSDVDICPIVAMTLALHGQQTVPAAAGTPLVAWR